MIRIDDDTNALEVIEGTQAAGHPPGCDPETGKFRADPIGTYSGIYTEAFPLIPESEWIDRIKTMTANGGFIGQRWQPDPKAHYQNGYPICWAYSGCQSIEAAMIGQGAQFVQLSPESLLGVCGNKMVGFYIDRAMAWAKEHGIAERRLVPQYKNNERDWSPEWKQNAINYRPLESWDCDGRDMKAQLVTALLCGCGGWGGLNWAGHAVYFDGLVLDGNKIGVHTPNSHGPGKDWTLFGAKAIPDELIIIRSVTFSG